MPVQILDSFPPQVLPKCICSMRANRIVHGNEAITDCTSVQPYVDIEYAIPIPLGSQCALVKDTEIRAPIPTDSYPNHHWATSITVVLSNFLRIKHLPLSFPYPITPICVFKAIPRLICKEYRSTIFMGQTNIVHDTFILYPVVILRQWDTYTRSSRSKTSITHSWPEGLSRNIDARCILKVSPTLGCCCKTVPACLNPQKRVFRCGRIPFSAITMPSDWCTVLLKPWQGFGYHSLVHTKSIHDLNMCNLLLHHILQFATLLIQINVVLHLH